MRNLSKEKIAKGKELVSKIRANQSRFQPDSFRAGRERPIYDGAYFEAINYLNKSPLDFQIQGVATIEDSASSYN